MIQGQRTFASFVFGIERLVAVENGSQLCLSQVMVFSQITDS
jgi:hypothetical protein